MNENGVNDETSGSQMENLSSEQFLRGMGVITLSNEVNLTYPHRFS